MEIVDIADDGCLIALKLRHILSFAEGLSQTAERPGHHSNPTDQISVQLTWMWWLRPWIVIDPRRENVSNSSSTPSIGFLGRKGLPIVGLDIAPLSLSKPEILSFEQRIEFPDVVFELAGVHIIV